MPAQTDPETLVSLGELSDIINSYFGLEDGDRVDYENPFSWWRRSTLNHHIALPMPEPVIRVGKRRSPLFHQADVLHWYGDWKNLEVPMGREAGDTVRGKRFVAGVRRG